MRSSMTSPLAEPRYYAVHMTSLDAEIFATRVGRETGAMYLQADAWDADWMLTLTRASLGGWLTPRGSRESGR